MKSRLLLLLALFLFYGNIKCQILSINDIVSWSGTDANIVGEHLVFRGWSEHGYEINKDSGFVRRTWMVQNKYNDLKSYFQYYISDADSSENYTIYQFSDRETFNSYRNELKRMGYKLQSDKKKRKKKKDKDKNKYKDKEELYLADKKNSLVSVKEVFLLGFNTFLVSTYNSKSRIGKTILEEEK
jgi:hypothetical protein